MSRVTITEGVRRSGMLTPFDAGTLRGEGAYVCSPVATVPEPLRALQRRRTDEYMTTGHRDRPDEAPRYYVTSGGTLLAWVEISGWPRFTDARELSAVQQRHQRRVRDAWRETCRALGAPDHFPADVECGACSTE